MMSSILPKYEPKMVRAEILTIFRSYFGRNDDFKYSFANLPTFRYVINAEKKLLMAGKFKLLNKLVDSSF